MLSSMRAWSKGWVIKGLFIFIALTFVTWGVGGYLNEQRKKPVATVDGDPISPQEFRTAYDEELNRMRRFFGGDLDKKTAEALGVKRSVLHKLIHRHLVAGAAQKLRLTVSESYLRQDIARQEVFYTNGRFDPERYQYVLRNNRLSPREYEIQTAGSMAIDQLDRIVRGVIQTPQILVEDFYTMDQERRSVSLITLSPTDLQAEITATDEDLTAYLKKHQAQFMTEAKTKVRFVELNSNSVRDQVIVSEEDIEIYYDERTTEFVIPETRTLSHILIRSDDTPEQNKAARRVISAIAKRIKAGEDFATVAKNESQDETTRGKGGDFGVISKGQIHPALDKRAFRLEEGAVSSPVKTPSGYHLIQARAITPERRRPLEEVKQDVRLALTEEKAIEMAYDQSGKLEDALYTSGDLASIASEMNLRIKETGLFPRNATGLEGLERNVKFLDAAFSTGLGELSALIELEDGRFFALRVLEREEPQPQTLEEARDDLTQAYKVQEASKLANERMEAQLKALQAGETQWEIALKALPTAKKRTPASFTYGDANTLSDELRQAAFQLKQEKPIFPRVLSEAGELVLLKLALVEPADPKGLAAASEGIRNGLERTLGDEQFQAYIEKLWEHSEIRMNETVYKPL